MNTTSHPQLFSANGSLDDTPKSGAATPSLRLARLWIDSCLARHRLCKLASPTRHGPRPTRLLNVSNPSRPFLEETSGSAWKPYIALSYCWGPGKKFVTLQENIRQHRRGIAANNLPATFKDAVDATRRLGYEHIWIDALCIIQDDKEDLEKELEHMGDIYRHAALTLCAADASSSHAGLFQDRNPLEIYPCRLRLLLGTGESTTSHEITAVGACHGKDHLVGRGWVLQEEILTSRALIFGSQLEWRCMESTAQETRVLPRTVRSDDSDVCPLPGADMMRLCLYAPERNLASAVAGVRLSALEEEGSRHFQAWSAMVTQYSDKDLSFASDTLRAIGGLAATFSSVHGTTYVAGLWREHPIPDLAWYVSVNDTRDTFTPTMRLTAPSWSWASVGKVRIRFRGEAWSTGEPIRKPNSAVVLDIFCASGDPINSRPQNLAGGNGSPRIPQEWSLRLLGPLQKFLLRTSKLHTNWCIDMSFGAFPRSGRDYSIFDGVMKVPGVYPRFPGALYHPRDPKRIVGEVAVDLPTLPSPCRTDAEGGQEIDVFCIPLPEDSETHSTLADFILCMVLVPIRPGSSSYARVGLGHLTEEGWFGGDSRDVNEEVDCDII